MANEEHLAILRQGIEVWNKWREANKDVQPDLTEVQLDKVLPRAFNLGSANFSRTIFAGADFSGVVLSNVRLTNAKLTNTNFKNVSLANADFTNANLTNADFMHARLLKAKLVGADLFNAKLGGVDLSEADLTGADLTDADLTGTDLSIANLTGARLSGAKIRHTNLTEANLYTANLMLATFTAADLTRATLTRALCGRTQFTDLDLSEVKGLETISHREPSSLGIETLYNSKGKIPEVFLRGCGVPQSLIDYIPSLIGAMEPIQFYSCFISYSGKDHNFAERLFSRMRDRNLRVWFANEDLKGGQLLDDQIEQAIRVHDKLILVLSEESIRSKWVMTEIRKTRKAELASNRRKFFPIRIVDMSVIDNWECIDPDSGQDLADEVRRYFIPDFTHWKDHDSFEREFTKLLNALKAVDEPPLERVETPSKILENKRRRLRILEEQQATMGLLTPVHVVIEIEDLRKEIADIGGLNRN